MYVNTSPSNSTVIVIVALPSASNRRAVKRPAGSTSSTALSLDSKLTRANFLVPVAENTPRGSDAKTNPTEPS